MTSQRALMMAVDLTPRFRRLNSQTRSFRENIQQGFGGPFGATQLWHNIIGALRGQVEVRRCRRHLRVHAECFPGCEAVDAVLSYLMQNVVFCSSEVSRLKAARLCQALMEAKVFEAVGTKLFRRDKEGTFEDSSSSLYRFLEYSCSANSAVKECDSDTENMTPDRQSLKRKKSYRLKELRTISNPLAVGASDRKVERLLRTINLPVAPHRTNPTAAFLSKAVVDEVWKQQALLQLLQMVELPMLDCILSSPGGGQLLTRQDLVISNHCVDRELPHSLHLPQLDAWLCAAADCLELFPDQLIVGAGEQLSLQQEQGEAQKRLLFDTIARYYGGPERAPLLSARHLDIHTAILSLLDAGQKQEAIRTSQLCFRLLDVSVRDELRRLLAFMSTAAHTDACHIQKQIDNRALLCRTFQRALVQDGELTPSQSQALVLFLMDNSSELFKTPPSLTEAVRGTLRTLQQGKDPDSIATFTFCQQVSPQQYEDQREAATLHSLKQLLGHITSSTAIPAKERRRLLRDFEKHHPVVFLKHLSSTF